MVHYHDRFTVGRKLSYVLSAVQCIYGDYKTQPNLGYIICR